MRWFPQRHFIFVGDSGYGTSESARFCHQHRRHLTLVSKFYGDAALYEPPPPRRRRTRGRPRVKGQKLLSPQEVVAQTRHRTRLAVAWYRGTSRDIEIVTGTGHWYRIGESLVAVRWVYVHDCTGTHRDEYLFTTALSPSQEGLGAGLEVMAREAVSASRITAAIMSPPAVPGVDSYWARSSAMRMVRRLARLLRGRPCG
jgi:DDE superfamily endonuclease